jgi:hypothetical protein
MDLSSKVYDICTKADPTLAVRGAYRRSHHTDIGRKSLGVYTGVVLRGD